MELILFLFCCEIPVTENSETECTEFHYVVIILNDILLSNYFRLITINEFQLISIKCTSTLVVNILSLPLYIWYYSQNGNINEISILCNSLNSSQWVSCCCNLSCSTWTTVGGDRHWLCARRRLPRPGRHSRHPHRDDGEEEPRQGWVSRRQRSRLAAQPHDASPGRPKVLAGSRKLHAGAPWDATARCVHSSTNECHQQGDGPIQQHCE